MNAKPTIVHLIQSLNSGGCENMLLRTLPLLSDEFKHVVVTLSEPGELAKAFTSQGIETVTVGMKGLFDGTGKKRLGDQLRVLRPALVITYLFHADVMGRLYIQKQFSLPVMPFLRTTYNSPKYWPARLFDRLTSRRVVNYLANSESVKTFYSQRLGVPAKKITVIPNGLDLSVFDRTNRDDVRKELSFSGQDFVVACVANLAANKGHRYLLDAFKDFYATQRDARLLIVGTGPELKNLKEQIAHEAVKEAVFFLGRRKDIPSILAAADVFVLPTQFEGMSNAILEAMAARKAVITSNIPENRVFMTHRKNGFLIEPKESRQIFEALQEVASNPKVRDGLGSAAREYIETHLQLTQIIKKWDEVLHRYATHT